MSKKTTKPEEKGFFDKVKKTIGGIWDGTKDKAEDLKHTAENTFEDLKDKITPEKPKAAKAATAKKAVEQKATTTVDKAKTTAAKTKVKVNDETKKAKNAVTGIKSKATVKPKTTAVRKAKA